MPTLRHEREAWKAGRLLIAGVDEAGRGPLAGPVVAAAVMARREVLEKESRGALLGVDDSKRLSPARREEIFAALTAQPGLSWAVGEASVEEIDRINILHATHLAMRRALAGLRPAPDLALVDGRPVPGLPCPAEAIVKGDAQSVLIAAASVVAKVTRDRLMAELDRAHPGYGLAQHKGYGTAAHLAALARLGPSACHRRGFLPVRQLALGFGDAGA